MNSLLRIRTEAQHGVFTTGDALRSGYSGKTLGRLVRTGAAVRLANGAYADGEVVRASSAAQRQALAARAALLSCGTGLLAASHHSAAVLLDLPTYGVPLGEVHLARTEEGQNRRCAAATIHRSYGPGATALNAGVTTVVPALACLGVAMLSGAEAGVVALDGALHRGLTSAAELRTWLARLAPRPHIIAARRAVDLADPRAESPGESRTRFLLLALGWQDVEPQAVVRDTWGAVVARVDFLLADRVVIEFDALVKYEGADGRTALAKEKRREDALSALGYQVVRVVWRDFDRPAAVGDHIRAALARSSGPVPRR